MRRALLDRLCCPYSGTELRVETAEDGGDTLEFGVLTSEAGSFAVVAGIPVLRLGQADLLALVRAGEHDAAVRRAAFGAVDPAGLHRMGRWLGETERLRAVGRRVSQRWQAGVDRRAAALTDPASGPRDLFALAYQELHLRNPEVFAYNWYRYSVPRHLAALAAMEWTPAEGPVLDLGCGAGHLTWALMAQRPERPVIGVDGLFFALYVARTRIAPGADYLCVDFDSLPLRDGTVRGVWASDVVHALAHKAAVARELERVTATPSWGAVVALTVAGHAHEYPGRPLSAAAYRALLPPATTLLPDTALVEAYRAGRAADRSAAAGGEGAATVTALWADPGFDGADGAPFDGWPHARGVLGVNPLFDATGRGPGVTRLRRHWPSAAYEREHGALRDWVPEEVEVPDAAVAAARAGRSVPDLERLIEQFVVLGLPAGYLAQPWPDAGG